MNKYRLDRTVFAIQSFEAAAHQRSYWLMRTPRERLEAAWYLICSAYNLPIEQPQKLDRSSFSMRKQTI